LAFHDLIDGLNPARRADAAGRALAAGFDSAEFHRKTRLFCHVDAVIKYDDPRVADQAIPLGKRLVIERSVKEGAREVRAERPANLNRAYGASACGAAADVVNEFPQRDTECDFIEARILYVPGELYRHCATRAADAEVFVEGRALVHDDRDGGEGEHVI